MGRLRDSLQSKPVEEVKPVEVPEPVEKPPEAPKVEVKAETKPKEVSKSQAVKVKDTGGRRWWLVGVGVIVGLMGFGGFAIFAGNQNTLLGLASVFCVIGGGFACYYGFKVQEGGMVIIDRGGKKKTDAKEPEITANSMNIYNGEILFEELPDDQLMGLPRKCRNLNKYFYTHILDTAWKNPKPENKLVEFRLPDTQYRDPRVFSLNLRIPAHRRLAQRKANLLEKISPWILIVAIVIVGIIWVATTPAKPGG